MSPEEKRDEGLFFMTLLLIVVSFLNLKANLNSRLEA